VTLAVTVVVVLIVVGWVVALVLFKAGETVNPPRPLTATTTGQG
jgi:hypothetical protein